MFRTAFRVAGGASAYRNLPASETLRSCLHRSFVSRATQKAELVELRDAGHKLLENPIYNKGSAFTQEERDELKLNGLLPYHVETLEEQKSRAYYSFSQKVNRLQKHIFMRQLQDTNETLFYSLMQDHIAEMLPIMYTPTVGHACRNFSTIFRRPRGIYLSYPNRHLMTQIFENLKTYGWTGAPLDIDNKLETKVIVATDGGRILGLGDLGANGMGISIGKCSLYTSVGGLPGWETLPIMLDVGTDNESIRNRPDYIGWRHERLDWRSPEYREFIEMFIDHVKRYVPHCLLQWEDFNIECAGPILKTYRDKLCTFNDDIQGTAVVTLGTLMAASKQTGRKISEQKIVMVGSGSAGCGIATMIRDAMVYEGLTEEQATAQIFMFDRPGLLHDKLDGMRDFQEPLAQKYESVKDWQGGDGTSWNLEEICRNAKPDIIVGVSGIPGLISEAAVKAMYENVKPRRPIIFPLSNPTERVEAKPADVMAWTDNTAIVATGTAFPPTDVVTRSGPFTQTVTTHVHTQCNNSYVFPACGLASKIVRPKVISDGMLMAAARALAETSPAKSSDSLDPLLLPLERVIECNQHVACAIALAAIDEGVATLNLDKTPEQIKELVNETFWHPVYKPVQIYSGGHEAN